MATIDVDSTTATIMVAGLRETILVTASSKTGLDVLAGLSCQISDPNGLTTGPFKGRMEVSLYKGAVSPANLQQSYTYTSSNTPDGNRISCLCYPVAAAADGDNGSSSTSSEQQIRWDVDPGTWTIRQEFSGKVENGSKMFTNVVGVSSTPALPFTLQRYYESAGHFTIEQILTVNA